MSSLLRISLSMSRPAARRNPPTHIAGLLPRAARDDPQSGMHLGVFEHGRETFLSYPALLHQARCISGGLRAHGRGPGSKVLLLLDRPGDFFPAFWGCVLGGCVPCPLPRIRNDAQRFEKQLAYVNCLLEHPLLVTTRELAAELTNVAFVDVDTLRSATPHERTDEAQLTDAVVLMLTSGSTGHSKAVVLTHENLLASMRGKTERQQLTAADVTLNWVSFDHVAALLESHLLPQYVGAVQVHVEPGAVAGDPLLFLRLIDRYRVSMAFAPNFLLGQINAALESAKLDHPLDLSCLRHIISGGEANVVETGRRFLDLLRPYGLARSALWPAFGMTETCAGCVYSRGFPHGEARRELASLGFPITGLQMRIVDADGSALPAGQSGELQLRGPMIFPRYHNNEEATRAAFTADGWFRTGDLGFIEDGRLSLVGRSKDSIIVSGVNYFSHELETALEQLEGVERSFVAVFPTRPRGADTEQLAIVFAPSFAPEEEARLYPLLIAIRNTTVLLWGFRPARILPLPREAFQKTSLGKIQRSLLRKRLEAGEFAACETQVARILHRGRGEHSSPRGPAETAIAEIFGRMFALEPAMLSATASFFDLGGTSLEIVKLKRQIEQRLGLADLPVATILQNPSVRALASRVVCARPGAMGEEYDPIVPLQLTGNKTPIFCVHAASGEVLVFVSLASYFAGDRPFYGLRASGFNPGEKCFATFDEMVGAYVNAIRKRQPHGPYAIAGYSYGGPVAFEIAKALESQGERVAFLSSLDGTPVIGRPGIRLDTFDSAATLAFFLSLIDQRQMHELPARLRAASVEDPYAQLIDIAPRERLAELDLDVAKLKTWARLSHALVRLGESYVPSGAVESVTVFYAQPLSGTKDHWLNAQLKQWNQFARKPNRYVEVNGEHHTLLGPKHVAGFHAVLRAEINQALGDA